MGDVAIINGLVNYLRSTGSRPLTIWAFHPQQMAFASMSDAGGVDSNGSPGDEANLDHTQGGWVIVTAERPLEAARQVRVSPVSWRSAKLKRKVSSTLAGETLALSQTVGQVEWLQILHQDVTTGQVRMDDWQTSLSPFSAVIRGNCEPRARLPQTHVVDAKSVYDVLEKGAAGGRQDRRSAVALAIIAQSMEAPRRDPLGLAPEDAGRLSDESGLPLHERGVGAPLQDRHVRVGAGGGGGVEVPRRVSRDSISGSSSLCGLIGGGGCAC